MHVWSSGHYVLRVTSVPLTFPRPPDPDDLTLNGLLARLLSGVTGPMRRVVKGRTKGTDPGRAFWDIASSKQGGVVVYLLVVFLLDVPIYSHLLPEP